MSSFNLHKWLFLRISSPSLRRQIRKMQTWNRWFTMVSLITIAWTSSPAGRLKCETVPGLDPGCAVNQIDSGDWNRVLQGPRKLWGFTLSSYLLVRFLLEKVKAKILIISQRSHFYLYLMWRMDRSVLSVVLHSFICYHF